MTEEGRKYLFDILHAIEYIDDFMTGIHTYDQYTNDPKTKSAVERQLGIIGEAANKYSKLGLNFQLGDSRSIITLRNRLIHSYDNVDDTIIWAILQRHLPKLGEEVIRGLNAE
mgnify:CR=1 FL=1